MSASFFDGFFDNGVGIACKIRRKNPPTMPILAAKAKLQTEPKAKCQTCPSRQFVPVTDDIIRWHLSGHDDHGKPFTAGVYPMLPDETCTFLAVDFDRDGWMLDIAAFAESCHLRNVPVAVERSRSGNGAHAWFFFAEPVPAQLARQMGSFLLTETTERRPEMGLASYDRLFPSQDTLPRGGFGNLIALPLQRIPRKRENSVFVNETFKPYADQWEYLSNLEKIPVDFLSMLVEESLAEGFGGEVSPQILERKNCCYLLVYNILYTSDLV